MIGEWITFSVLLVIGLVNVIWPLNSRVYLGNETRHR